jgi:MinD superfamily P-loop ATPase
VISALSGIDLVIIVTEPTVSGRHDLYRVAKLCDHFNIPAAVVINKCDLNPNVVNEIQSYCKGKGMLLLAKVPHTNDFIHAMVKGLTITEYTNSDVTRQLQIAWERICRLIGGRKAA